MVLWYIFILNYFEYFYFLLVINNINYLRSEIANILANFLAISIYFKYWFGKFNILYYFIYNIQYFI